MHSGEELTASAWAQVQADGMVERLREQAAALRERQTAAFANQSEKHSQDGSVRVVVDASGAVLALEFAPSALQSTPDRLARTVLATIQAAAAKARGELNEALQAAREDNATTFATAAQGAAGLGLPRMGVPEAPVTEQDPTAPDPTSWSEQPPETAADTVSADHNSFGTTYDERPW
jgi:DNA-binding protein YbaB